MSVHPNQISMQSSKKILGTVPFSAAQKQELAVQNGLPKDYYYKGLFMQLSGRYTAGTTAGTFNAEAGQNLLEMIELAGNHKVLGDWTPYRLQGGHTFTIGNIEDGFTHKRLCSVNGGALGAFPVAGTAPLAAGTYDFIVTFHVSFPPRRVNISEQFFYLLDAPYWNTLQLYIYWGGIGSFVSGYGGTPTLTAYGSGAGSPSLAVTREIVKLSGSKNNLRTIPLRRSVKYVPMLATQVGQYVADLNKGNLIRSFWFAAGTTATGNSLANQGDNFASLSDSILTRITPKRDDNAQRDVFWADQQEFEAQQKQLAFTGNNPTAQGFPPGYNLLDFCEDNTLASAYNTIPIARNNSRWELWGDVTGAASQKLHIITEEFSTVPVLTP